MQRVNENRHSTVTNSNDLLKPETKLFVGQGLQLALPLREQDRFWREQHADRQC